MRNKKIWVLLNMILSIHKNATKLIYCLYCIAYQCRTFFKEKYLFTTVEYKVVTEAHAIVNGDFSSNLFHFESYPYL